MRIYDEIDIGTHVKKVSAYAQDRLAALAENPIVDDAKGVGLIGSIELVKNKETRENFAPEIAAWCTEACIRHGVILRQMAGVRIAFCPPLIIEEKELELLFDRWELALNDTLEYVRSEGLI